MKATFWAAYASRLHRLADRIEAARTPEDLRSALQANSDLWAALEADVRSGLAESHAIPSLSGLLLTRARTVAEQSRSPAPGLAALSLLNRQTALALAAEAHPTGL